MEKLVYVKPFSRGIDGNYEYKFFYSEHPENVWGIDWLDENPSYCDDLTPDKSTYDSVEIVKVKLPFKTASENSCYSMEYCTYDILALSWIDIDDLEEYPEDGRCVLHFGMEKEKVQELLEPYKL